MAIGEIHKTTDLAVQTDSPIRSLLNDIASELKAEHVIVRRDSISTSLVRWVGERSDYGHTVVVKDWR